MQEELLDPEGLAALLGLTVKTLHNWRHKGEGPRSFRVGGRVRYRRSEVEQWLEAQEAAAATT